MNYALLQIQKYRCVSILSEKALGHAELTPLSESRRRNLWREVDLTEKAAFSEVFPSVWHSNEKSKLEAPNLHVRGAV